MVTLGTFLTPERSLVGRRLYRWARESGDDEPFIEHACDNCGEPWCWNTNIYPDDEPHRCEQCAPDEHPKTHFSETYLNAYLAQWDHLFGRNANAT